MKPLAVCSLILLFPSLLFAQTSSSNNQYASAAGPGQQTEVRGRVLDATGGPIAHARVTVRLGTPGSTPAVILSDGQGEFSLPVTPGTYSVLVTADGFVTASQRVDVRQGEQPMLNVVLRVAGFSEIVNVDALADRPSGITSATRTPTPLRDVPQAVSIVGRELIGELRMSSMADVVRFMPGVGMAQGEGNRDAPVFRGNSTTADFFVDGVRDDVQYFRDVYNLERVEALKGPNAMIFGRGGAGGVINRVTRQADWQQTRELSAQVGSWDNRRLTADFGNPLNDTAAVRVTGMYENSDSYRDGVGVERFGVQPSVAVRLGPSTLLRASYEHFHDERVADRGIPSFDGRPVASEVDTFFGDPTNSPTHATVNLLASIVEHEFNDRLTLRNRISYGMYDKFYQNVYPTGMNTSGTLVNISAYNNATDRDNFFNQTDLVANVRTGGLTHTVLAGAELGRQATDNFRQTGYFTGAGDAVTSVQLPLSSPTAALPVTFRQSATDADNHGIATIAAVYAQDQVQLTSWLQAVAGIRFDAFDLDFKNNRSGQELSSRDRLISPRLGVVYKPLLPVSIYGSYSLTYVPRGGDQLSSLSLTNEALEPEKFENYEAGVKWDLAGGLSATAAVYRLNRGNVAVADPADPTRLILVDAQRTRGVELELTGSISPALNLVASYAFQDGEITRAISNSTPAGNVLAHVPAHSLSLWGNYRLTSRWSAALGLVHRSSIFASADNQVVLPGYTRADGAIFFDVNSRLRAQVNVENLFDEDYFASAHNNNNITPGAPRGVRFAITTRF